MKKIYQAPVAVCCPMTVQGYLLDGSIHHGILEHKDSQTETEINVGQDEEDITGLSKKTFAPWSSWDE